MPLIRNSRPVLESKNLLPFVMIGGTHALVVGTQAAVVQSTATAQRLRIREPKAILGMVLINSNECFSQYFSRSLWVASSKKENEVVKKRQMESSTDDDSQRGCVG